MNLFPLTTFSSIIIYPAKYTERFQLWFTKEKHIITTAQPLEGTWGEMNN